MLTSDKAEAVLEAFGAIWCNWRLWYEPQVSMKNGFLRYWQRIKREVLQVVGEMFSPCRVVSPCLSMSFQVVQLVSEPGSFTRTNLVFSVGSNMWVFYYLSATSLEAEKKLKRCLLPQVGWFCPGNQILSLCEMQLLFPLRIHTRLVSSG